MDQKKIDPGWNDPPTISYSASNPPPKSRITNKRVAFPLTSDSPNASNTQSLPPGLSVSKQPPAVSPQLPPSKISSTPQGQENIPSPDDIFKIVKENFAKLILNSDIQIHEELVLLLYKLWEEGKFSGDCQNYIYLLSKCLVENDEPGARQMKEKLLTEFKDSCEEWLNGIIT